MPEKFERFGLGLRVRESVNSDSAEIVGDGDDVEFLWNVASVDVSSVGDLRPNSHRLESQSAKEQVWSKLQKQYGWVSQKDKSDTLIT